MKSSPLESNQSFDTHKTSFFNVSEWNTDAVENEVSNVGAEQYFAQQEAVLHELNDLSSVLEMVSCEKENEIFFYFTLYCCHLLKNYHAARREHHHEQLYQQKIDLFIERIRGEPVDDSEENETDFTTFVKETFYQTWADLQQNLFNPSRFSEKVGLINLSRIILVLSRLSLSQLFVLLDEKDLLERLARFLHRDLSAAHLIERMSMFNGVLNAMSVAMFGCRWLRNTLSSFIYVFFPTQKVLEAQNSSFKRITDQLYSRKGEFLNDGAWTIVNGMTNYQLFGMSASVSLGITAGFMFFDVGVLLYLRHCAEKAYVRKQQAYEAESVALKSLLEQKLKDSGEAEFRILLYRLQLLEKQQVYGQIHWAQTGSIFNFQIAAVMLLGTSFSFSLLVASPAAIVVCYTLSLAAVSMVLSSKDFGVLQQTQAKIDHADLLDLNRDELAQNYRQTQIDLAVNLVKNAIVPMLLIGTFLICWEAGLLLALSYVAFEGGRYYLKHYSDSQEDTIQGEIGATPRILLT